MLKAIVFDFDGVLVDSEPLHYAAFREIARGLGADFDYQQYLAELVGFDDRDAFDHILRRAAPAGAGASTNPGHERIAELCDRKQDAFEALVREGIAPLPGALDLADAAANENMPIAIASGAVRRDIALILDQLGRAGAFEVIVTADDVARSKPDPESYALAAQRLGERHPQLALAPGECLAIEDTAAGIASARDAGLRTLAVATTHQPDHLTAAERVVGSLADVTIDALRAWYA